MTKNTMDAIKVARAIQQNDLSSLLRKSFVIVDNHVKIKKKPGRKMKKKSKYSLNQLGTKVDKLDMTVNKLGTRVDKLATKVDQIADALMALTKTVNTLANDFYSFKKEINARLDYNNLKKLPETNHNK